MPELPSWRPTTNCFVHPTTRVHCHMCSLFPPSLCFGLTLTSPHGPRATALLLRLLAAGSSFSVRHPLPSLGVWATRPREEKKGWRRDKAKAKQPARAGEVEREREKKSSATNRTTSLASLSLSSTIPFFSLYSLPLSSSGRLRIPLPLPPRVLLLQLLAPPPHPCILSSSN